MSYGDPHFYAWDSSPWEFQDAGDFVLATIGEIDRNLTIHVRHSIVAEAATENSAVRFTELANFFLMRVY